MTAERAELKCAKDVQFAHQGSTSRRTHAESAAPWSLPRLVVLPAFVGLYAIVAALWTVKPVAALIYLVMSLATFMVYGFDKAAARADRWRTSEDTLHLLSLAGGWPGALLAQQWMRHKTSKDSFRRIYWVTVCMNMSGFVALHSPWLRAKLPW